MFDIILKWRKREVMMMIDDDCRDPNLVSKRFRVFGGKRESLCWCVVLRGEDEN